MDPQNLRNLNFQNLRENYDNNFKGGICRRWFRKAVLQLTGKRRGQHVVGSLGLKASVPQERAQGVCLLDCLPLFKNSCRTPLFPLWTLAFHSVPFPQTNWRKESENSYRNQKLPSPWLHQNMWEDHSRQTSEWISAWLLQCWDNKAAVSNWRVRKPNSLGSFARNWGVERVE